MNTETPRTTGRFQAFIAYLQIIGIILVVIGHSFHLYPDGEHGHSLLLYRMLYSFRMPLFMFVSGYLMIYTTRMNPNKAKPGVGKFISGKVKRLLIPFFVLSAVTFLPRVYMSGMADDALSLDLHSFLMAFIHPDKLVIPYFWFIQASFIVLCVSYVLMRLFERLGMSDKVLYPVIAVICLLLPWLPIEYTAYFSMRLAVYYSLYFSLGMLYARFSYAIDRAVDWASPVFFIASAAVWCGLFLLTEGTDWVILSSLAGICMGISMAKLLVRYEIHWLDHLVGANYIIFLLSWYCNVATQQVLVHFVPSVPWWVCTVLSLFSGIYVPWLGYRYLRKHTDSRWGRFTAFLLGQSFKTRVPSVGKRG